ncbi:MAG: hypothetical protein R3A47_11490 [Polyangiales bacterium]
MFSDFDGKKKTTDGRGRMGLSLALSSVVYLLLAGGLAAAIATARAVVVKKERDVDVEFATLAKQPKPEMEKPKPKPKPKPKEETVKAKDASEGQRRNLNAPTEIPDEKLREASGGRLVKAEAIDIDQMIGGGKGKDKEARVNTARKYRDPSF